MLWAQNKGAPKARSVGPPKGFVPPRLLKFVQATYPPEAKKQGKTAMVTMQLVVDEKGAVRTVKVVGSAGEAFDKAATKAVKKFRFQPATYKKKPVPVRILYRYHFVLKKVKVPARRPASRPASRPMPRRRVVRPTPPPVRIDKRTMVAGYILQRGSRDPIEGAPLYIIGRRLRRRVDSDEDGSFRIPRLPLGRYRIVVPVPNYKKYRRILLVVRSEQKRLSANVLPDVIVASHEKALQINLYLESEGTNLFETVTRGQRRKREVYRETLSKQEIMILPGTQGDPLKVIQNLPGVARTPLNTGFFVVRGSAPEDSRTYLDGHQIPQLYHFGGLTAVVNGDLAKQLNFIPGGFSVAFGRSMGGVINLETRAGSERFHGYIDVDLIDAGLFLEGPLWKGATFVISARRSYLDVVLNAVLPDNRNFDLTVAPRYYDLQAKIDWKIGSQHRLRAMFYMSDDRLSFLRETPIGRGDIRGEFNLVQSFYRLNFGWLAVDKKKGAVENELTFDIGYNFANAGGGGFGFDTGNYVISVREELRVKPAKSVRFRMGMDLRVNNFSLELVVPESEAPTNNDRPGSSADPLRSIRGTSVEFWQAEPALYAEVDWEPIQGWRMIAGGRGDYHSIMNKFTFDPRLTLAVSPTKALTLKGTVGLFSQPPQGQELSEDFGNPALDFQQSIHYNLGAQVDWTSYLMSRVTFYYKDLFSLVANSDQIVTRNGKPVRERFANTGSGRAYGLELLIRHKPHRRIFGWISYTLGRSERRNNDDEEFSLFGFDQTHILTVLGAYKIGAGFTLSARFRLVSGNPTTPRTGGIFDADAGRYFPVSGPRNSERNALFHQLDVRLDYALTFDRWKLLFYLDVQNVYNQANQEGVSYNYDSSRSAPLTGIPIFPSLGIKGEF